MSKAGRGSAVLAFVLLLLVGPACGPTGSTEPASLAPGARTVVPPPSPPVTPSQAAQGEMPVIQPTVAPFASPGATGAGEPEAWQTLQPGLERRHVNLLAPEGGVRERLYMLRIDPAHFTFDVSYRPGAPQRLMDWQQETGALIVVNGGYFTADNVATGLTIVNGQASGASYSGFGGMLAIGDGGPMLRSLIEQPYNPHEPLRAGLQSFPLLVTSDGRAGFPQEDGLADRRTGVAQDRQGRLLFIIAGTGTLTLHEFSRYLAESDLDIALALNLDGGASTGIQLADPPEGIAPFSLLPQVITVRPRT